MEITQKTIEQWKAQHGKIFQIKVGDKVCYLKQPSRKALSYAAVSAQTDPLKYNEVILNDCWLAGDEEIKTNNGLFLSVSQKLNALIEIKEAELVKL